MSLHLDYAEISREARRIVDANRARKIIEQVVAQSRSTSVSDSTPLPSTPTKVKFTRSTAGCRACRTHKVKCDETTPTCLRCVAAQRLCEYPPPGEGSRKRKKDSAGRDRRSESSVPATDGERDKRDKERESPAEAQKRVRTEASSSWSTVERGGSASGTVENGMPQQPTGLEQPQPPTSSARDFTAAAGTGVSVVGGTGNWRLGDSTRPGPTDHSAMSGRSTTHSDTLGQSSTIAFSPNDFLNSTPDLSFLNDFIPFVNNNNINNPSPSFVPNPHPQLPIPNFPPPDTIPTNVVHTSNSHEPVRPLNEIASATASSSQQQLLPRFDNLTKSLLLNRRMIKPGVELETAEGTKSRTPSVPPHQSHPRLHMVDTMLLAFAHDEALFEFGPSHRNRSLSNNILTAGSIDILSNAFPSPTARTLFHHYCNTASRILITMGNIGPNPLLALCTPIKLLDTSSAASAAVRMSMLSIAVAHFSHETKEAVGQADLGPMWDVQKRKLKEMGSKFKRAALANITLTVRSEMGQDQLDNVLAACTLLCIRDVISADPTWRDNLEFALNLVNKKGGPQALLAGAGYSFTRRYLLENLATHDVFASFITGKEPAVLGNYDTWWFDSVETSQTRWEWESVERSFGISRAMVDLVARIAVLDSQKRRLSITLQNSNDEMWDVAQHFERESHCLLLELDIWGNSLNALPQHIRVTCGDYIYKYMAVVFLLADILEQPTSTPRIVKSIDNILELLSEASAMRMSVMLIWPLLIAGVFTLPEKRWKVRELFDAFQSDYCEDLEVARALIEEQWRGIDAGEGKQPWDKVMNKLGRYALLI